MVKQGVNKKRTKSDSDVSEVPTTTTIPTPKQAFIGCGLGDNPGEMGGVAQQYFCARMILKEMKDGRKSFVGYDDQGDVSVFSMEESKLSLYEVKYSDSVRSLKSTLEDALVRIKLEDSVTQTLVVCCKDDQMDGRMIVDAVVRTIKEKYYLERVFSRDDTVTAFSRELFKIADCLSDQDTLGDALDRALDKHFFTENAKVQLLQQLAKVSKMEVFKVTNVSVWQKEIIEDIRALWPEFNAINQKAVLVSLLISTHQMMTNRRVGISLLINLIDIPICTDGENKKNKVDCFQLRQKLSEPSLMFEEKKVDEAFQDHMMESSLSQYKANELLRSFMAFAELLYVDDRSVEVKAGLIKSFFGSMKHRATDIDPVDFKSLGFDTLGAVTQNVCSKLLPQVKAKIVKVCKISDIFNDIGVLNEEFGNLGVL